MPRIPIITMHQPWGTFVDRRWKLIETRTHRRFRSLVGKRIGIHASASPLPDNDPYVNQAIGMIQALHGQSVEGIGFPHGVIICTAQVIKFDLCGQDDEFLTLIESRSTKRYGLWLDDVRPVTPNIHVRGRQGIWYHEVPS